MIKYYSTRTKIRIICLVSHLANIAPNRLYVAKATKPSERMTHISLLSLFQTLGFVLGPGMQAALSPIGEKSEIPENSSLHIDMYAACG